MTVLDLFQLHGKVAVVTGASSGLGVAAAQALAEAGADVALGARRVDRLADTGKLVEAAGRRALAVQTDVRRPENCRRLIDQTVETLGRVDILLNNAGVGAAVPASLETPSSSDPFSRSTSKAATGWRRPPLGSCRWAHRSSTCRACSAS